MDLLVDEKLVERLWRRNNFPARGDELAFFALRGALPVDLNGTPFAPSHSVRLPGVDYVHLRCTFGQWSPGKGIAVFPGSTVPFLNYIKASLGRGGAGTNMLMLGCYGYEKGVHKLGTPTQHRAFRQHGFFPVWRTADDADYDLSDKLDTSPTLVWDDLHAAWCADPSVPHYASAGCQVVAGFPQSPRTNNEPDAGPWALFRKVAYDSGQTLFSYGLFSGAEALSVASRPDDEVRQSLRFGSRGDLVERLQRSLIAQGFPLSEPDGDLGRETLEALMAFQQRRFGPGTADGVVGPQTAGALELELPFLSDLTGQGTRRAGSSQRQGAAPAAGLADAGPPHAEARDATDLVDPVVVRAGPVPAERSAPKTIELRQDGDVWTATAGDRQPNYVGTETNYEGRRGLYQNPKRLGDIVGGVYDPDEWGDAIGDWGPFIQPTAQAESSGHFGRLNTYDSAAFTWGFFQFAAHTAQDNLILLFRQLLTLPNATSYFPDLALVDGRVVQKRDDATVSLDVPTGHPMTAFMGYLNPDPHEVGKVEALNAARLALWTAEDPAARAAQVKLAVAVCRRRLAYGVRRYGLDIVGKPLRRAVWVADALHQGRATYAQLRDALASGDPDAALANVGLSSRYESRIKTVQASIAEQEARGRFKDRTWGSGLFLPEAEQLAS